MKSFLSLILLMGLLAPAHAQLSLPPSGKNQKAMVQQNIGPLVQVTIRYSSPDVTAPNGQDRKGQIWGQLVPYGFTQQGFGLNNPSPWRAGANECTTIKFSHDVLVEGKKLAAGTYAFFVAPAESGSWTLVFSKNTSGWGSYFYEEKDDALRVMVIPQTVSYHEWLTYEFSDRQANSTIAALVWEEKSVPFKIEVPNNNELIVAQLNQELTGADGFTWTNWVSAANFTLQNNVALEQGLKWAEQAISGAFVGVSNFTTLSTKSQVLSRLGRNEEAAATMDKAIKHPTAGALQIHGYGRSLLAAGQKEKALEVFEYNKEKHGDVWPVRVGLARAHSELGNYKKALEHAKVAHDRAPDQLNKDALAKSIEQLKAGKAM
jgi:tetratricopeptide (TPR) repeat protein